MKLRNKFLTTGLMALVSTGLLAQETSTPTASAPASQREIDRWSVGVNGGVLLFYGDIRQYDFYPVTEYNSEWRFGGGLTVNRSFNSFFSLQGQLLFGQLSGSRAIRRAGRTFTSTWPADVYFETNIFEYGVNAVINLSNLTLSQRSKPRKLSVYALAGLGLVTFDSEVKSLQTEFRFNKSGKTTETVVPVGLGVKYKINNKFDVGLETTFGNVNTDKLDATVVNGSASDKYSYSDVTLTYKFGENADKNQWVNPLDALVADMNTMKAKVEGLSNDTDKDGVADIFDKDNSTPDGVKVYGDGTAVDTDGDGVADAQDADPFTVKGAKVDSKGKEADSDNDGVSDSKDLEPNTASGALVNFPGKAIKVENSDNTEISSTGYLPSVYFQSGSANVQYKYYENLAAVARVLKANPSLKLTVVGHADTKGSDKINEKLAQKRAEAVVKHLSSVYGIEASRLTAQSKGKTETFAKGNDAMNRRVDFKVSK
jgi:OmpA-OmpF porin, OOP family